MIFPWLHYPRTFPDHQLTGATAHVLISEARHLPSAGVNPCTKRFGVWTDRIKAVASNPMAMILCLGHGTASVGTPMGVTNEGPRISMVLKIG